MENSNKDVKELDSKQEAIVSAHMALKSTYNAAAVIESYGGIYGEQSVSALAEDLSKHNKKVINGDLTHVEEMLLDQSHALQSIFTNLSRRALKVERMDNLERYLRLALKAQAQCARTLEVLGAIKNPTTVALVKQANIGHAVQVNNGPPETTEIQSRARKNLNSANELLEVKNGQSLDIGATSTTIKTDSQLEPLEKINRAKDSSGQS